MNNSLKPYEIITMAAGAVMFVFSFLDWFSAGGEGRNAWGQGFLPLATLMPLIGLLSAGLVALRAFGNSDIGDSVLGFTRSQIHLILSVYALLIGLHYLLVEKGVADLGIGFWFNLLGAIGLLVGAVMMRQDEGTAGAGGAAPPQTF